MCYSLRCGRFAEEKCSYMLDALIQKAVDEFTEYFRESGFKVSASSEILTAEFGGVQVFLELLAKPMLVVRSVATEEVEKHFILISNQHTFLLKNRNPQLLGDKYTKHVSFTEILKSIFI